jgi:hypothetical protein
MDRRPNCANGKGIAVRISGNLKIGQSKTTKRASPLETTEKTQSGITAK